MGADSFAENTPNAQFVRPSPKVWDFNEKVFIAQLIKMPYHLRKLKNDQVKKTIFFSFTL